MIEFGSILIILDANRVERHQRVYSDEEDEVIGRRKSRSKRRRRRRSKINAD
jgi:hypothetical protein